MNIKRQTTKNLLAVPLLAASLLQGQIANAGEASGQTNAAPRRIGIYDSRAVAYAHFYSEGEQRKRSEQFKECR